MEVLQVLSKGYEKEREKQAQTFGTDEFVWVGRMIKRRTLEKKGDESSWGRGGENREFGIRIFNLNKHLDFDCW